MLILEYISTHGTPEWCAARMSARESRGRLPAYEQPCTSCIRTCWLYAWREGPTLAGCAICFASDVAYMLVPF